MLLQVRNDRHLPPIQRGVPETVDSFIGLDPEGYEVSSRTTNKDVGGNDLHWCAISWTNLVSATIDRMKVGIRYSLSAHMFADLRNAGQCRFDGTNRVTADQFGWHQQLLRGDIGF